MKINKLYLSKKNVITLTVFLVCIFLSIVLHRAILSINNLKQIKLSDEDEINLFVPGVLVSPIIAYTGAIKIKASGFVNELTRIKVTSRIDGEINYLCKELDSGKLIKKGNIIVSVDKSFYQQKLKAADSSYKAFCKKLEIAKEKQKLEKELKLALLDEDLDDSLKSNFEVLSAQAEVEDAILKQAEAIKEIKGTNIRAPFNCYSQALSVRKSQIVQRGDMICEITPSDFSEISVSLPMSDVFRLNIPNFYPNIRKNAGEASLAEIQIPGTIIPRSWPGQVVRFDGINRETKLAIVIVKIEYDSEFFNPFRPGMFCNVVLYGREEFSVYSVPFDSVINGNIIWIVDENYKLDFKKVKILDIKDNAAIIKSDLKKVDIVVVPRGTEASGFTKGSKVNIDFLDLEENELS